MSEVVSRQVARAMAVSVLLLASVVTPAQAQQQPPRPVEANGQLRVVGNKITSQAGRPVQLRGVALHGLQWSGWFYEDSASLRAAALEWGIDVLRISVYVYEDGYLDNPELEPADFDQMIDGCVATCVETGIYCILDWHVHHPGNPLYYTEQAKLFFARYSEKYAALPNILYEIANEPNRTGYQRMVDGEPVTIVEEKPTPWADIKAYAEQVIPVIRANDPDGLVLVGTPAWSQLGHSDGYDWRDVVNQPLGFDNLVYVVHFYAAGHGLDMLNRYQAAALELPLFATEWSPAHYSMSQPFTADQAVDWVEWMKSSGIGGTYWNWAAGDDLWSPFDSSTTAQGPFAPAGPNITPSGQYLYDWLNNPPDAWADSMGPDPQTPGMGGGGMGGSGNPDPTIPQPDPSQPQPMAGAPGTAGSGGVPASAGTSNPATPGAVPEPDAAPGSGCACRAVGQPSQRAAGVASIALIALATLWLTRATGRRRGRRIPSS
jgi:endoglucanase